MKYLQMAAGDRFSRIGSYAGTLFLSAVNVRISSPSDPRHLHIGIAICTVHYSSRGVSVSQLGKPRKGTNTAAYCRAGRNGVYGFSYL